MLKQETIESNVGWMVVLIVILISFAGLVEILPLFYQRSTTEPVAGMKPLTALQLAGRELYIREGCYNCHSQMIRPFRAETERYGHYSVAGESVWEHPFLWGNNRRGPDLARVGSRYSDDWHRAHLNNPRDVVPESIMPAYPWFAKNKLDASDLAKKMAALRTLGVPYTDKDIANAQSDVAGKYEIDAIIAYLQQLGTVIKNTR